MVYCVRVLCAHVQMCVWHGHVTWQEGTQLGSLWVSGAGLQPPLVLSIDLLPLGIQSFQGTLISPQFKPPPSLFAISELVKSFLVLSVDLDVKAEDMECFLDDIDGRISGCSKHLTDSSPYT